MALHGTDHARSGIDHRLPDLPFDTLAEFAATARRHPDGIVDLSMGSPVDPTPQIIRDALADATDAHAYPTVLGTIALRSAIVDWYERRRGVPGLEPAEALPTIGSKEFIAGLPGWLGLGPGDVVVHPTSAYPTYAVGAALAQADPVASDDPAEWPDSTRLIWLNSPRNPDGTVLDLEQLRRAVERARQLGAVIASDECYAELGWKDEWSDATTPSVLDPRVVGDTRRGVLSVYSLSKQSNLAGYRAGFVAGDAEILARLLAVRRHSGLITPAPVQEAMRIALSDPAHVADQKRRYRDRRALLVGALQSAGFRIEASEAGLFIWATRDESALDSVAWLADRGILVTPGHIYSAAGANHVRVALTATDERIAAAATRLAS